MLALFCVYLCDGNYIEDITTILNRDLGTVPNARKTSSDTSSSEEDYRAMVIGSTRDVRALTG